MQWISSPWIFSHKAWYFSHKALKTRINIECWVNVLKSGSPPNFCPHRPKRYTPVSYQGWLLQFYFTGTPREQIRTRRLGCNVGCSLEKAYTENATVNFLWKSLRLTSSYAKDSTQVGNRIYSWFKVLINGGWAFLVLIHWNFSLSNKNTKTKPCTRCHPKTCIWKMQIGLKSNSTKHILIEHYQLHFLNCFIVIPMIS